MKRYTERQFHQLCYNAVRNYSLDHEDERNHSYEWGINNRVVAIEEAFPPNYVMFPDGSGKKLKFKGWVNWKGKNGYDFNTSGVYRYAITGGLGASANYSYWDGEIRGPPRHDGYWLLREYEDIEFKVEVLASQFLSGSVPLEML